MSLKHEQYRSLYYTRLFLRDLLAGAKMTKKEMKQRASLCLHHYPFLCKNGKPMFSEDQFECPDIEKENNE